jgi:hypothetical protein
MGTLTMRARRAGCMPGPGLWLALALAVIGGPAQGQQRYWYDGGERRLLWAESGLRADFNAAPGTTQSVIQPVLGDKPAAPAGPTDTPVYRDQPSAGGRVRALPGGVIVGLRPGTSAAARDALLARHGLRLVRPIGDRGDVVLVASPPGDASLDLANRLHESGDFASASPNWWQPRQLK